MKPIDRFSYLKNNRVRYLISGTVLPPDYRSGGAEPLSLYRLVLG